MNIKSFDTMNKQKDWIDAGNRDRKDGKPCNPPKSKHYAKAYMAGYQTHTIYASTRKRGMK